jgi:hypothetical protein
MSQNIRIQFVTAEDVASADVIAEGALAGKTNSRRPAPAPRGGLACNISRQSIADAADALCAKTLGPPLSAIILDFVGEGMHSRAELGTRRVRLKAAVGATGRMRKIAVIAKRCGERVKSTLSCPSRSRM